MKSHTVLKRRYGYFNRKYFNGCLPTDVQILWAPLDTAHGCAWPGEGIIHMDPPLMGNKRHRDIILLHEMIHIRHPRANHGKVFQAEKARLFAMGAYKDLL